MGKARLESKGSARDALLLSFVKVLSIVGGLLTTVVLSHQLPMAEYGTYAQANLVVTIASTLTALGLSDAANYFYNRALSAEQRGAYIDTVVTVQVLIGAVTAAIILVFGLAISSIFSNPLLNLLWVYVCLRPVLINVGLTLQVLIVSIGKAGHIALRNAAFTILKLLILGLLSAINADLQVLLAALLGLDLASTSWFWITYNRFSTPIRARLPRWLVLRPILSFSLPMAIFVGSSVVGREFDKLIIATNLSSREFAVYANASIVLPLDIIASSFLVVMIPILTRYVSSGDYVEARRLFRHYLELGYLTTTTFAMAALLVAPELISILFGARYLPGVDVFRCYLIAAVFRFGATSLVLSACGRTRTLMSVALLSTLVTIIAAPTAFHLFGFIGPAIAATLVSAFTALIVLTLSGRAIAAKARDLFDLRSVARFCISSFALFVGLSALMPELSRILDGEMLRVAVVPTIYIVGVFALNWRRLRIAFRILNAMR